MTSWVFSTVHSFSEIWAWPGPGENRVEWDSSSSCLCCRLQTSYGLHFISGFFLPPPFVIFPSTKCTEAGGKVMVKTYSWSTFCLTQRHERDLVYEHSFLTKGVDVSRSNDLAQIGGDWVAEKELNLSFGFQFWHSRHMVNLTGQGRWRWDMSKSLP